MTNTIVLITGANTGLGFQTVKALCQSSRSYTILLGGRNISKAEAAAKEAQELASSPETRVQPVQIDIEDDESIASLFNFITEKHGRVDILLNNAGAQFDQQLSGGEISMRDMWNKSWNVNTTSTFILTNTFVPLLLKSSDPRLLFIASGTATLTEHEDPAIALNKSPDKGWPKPMLGIPAYRASKTGLNMMMREWTRLLKEDGVKTWCVSPGFLATGLGFGAEKLKAMGAMDPAMGAAFVKDVVEGQRDEDAGKVIRRDGIQPW